MANIPLRLKLLFVILTALLACWVVYDWRSDFQAIVDNAAIVGTATRGDREQARQVMEAHAHPVWRELWDGLIKAGDPIEGVIAATEPLHVARSGRFVRLHYEPRGGDFLTITARDGRLVAARAGGCVWSYTFFDEMGRADWTEFGGTTATGR